MWAVQRNEVEGGAYNGMLYHCLRRRTGRTIFRVTHNRFWTTSRNDYQESSREEGKLAGIPHIVDFDTTHFRLENAAAVTFANHIEFQMKYWKTERCHGCQTLFAPQKRIPNSYLSMKQYKRILLSRFVHPFVQLHLTRIVLLMQSRKTY